MPYVGQETNTAMKSYHTFMKSILKAERSRMSGRHVDWCIYRLTSDVLSDYWHQGLRKYYEMVQNKKRKEMVVFALIRAHNMLDIDVTLPRLKRDPAYFTYSTQRHVCYVVDNLDFEWVVCNCVHAPRRNI